jgi:peptidyl-prolyl cis-trans isomerase SurA
MAKNKDEFIQALDTNLLNGEWTAERATGFQKPLFTLGDKTYSQQDFAAYIASHQSKRTHTTPQAVGYQLYESFVDETCLAYEEQRLDEKYPDFKALMREYRDGILLFDLTDQKVWSKAVKDTAGLEAFYQANREKYMWGERADAAIYTCNDAKVAARVRKLLKKKTPVEKIKEEINSASALNLTVKEGKFSRGDNELIDSVAWVPGLSPDLPHYNQLAIVEIRAVLPPQPKALDEARGLVTADYQNQLEKEWIAQLRKKYTVAVDEAVLNTVGKH